MLFFFYIVNILFGETLKGFHHSIYSKMHCDDLVNDIDYVLIQVLIVENKKVDKFTLR